MYSDITSTDPQRIAGTFGSGGGLPGSGRGGGRILIRSTSNVLLDEKGLLEASGSGANVTTLGAGSGSSVTVVARTFTQKGRIEAVGGAVTAHQADTGASGGGGRVMISVSHEPFAEFCAELILLGNLLCLYLSGCVGQSIPNPRS